MLCTSCARADSSVAACRHLQQPSLPLSLLKFIVLVLLSFSNLLKFTCFLRSYVKPFKTHILRHSPPNKTKFIHGPKSQSVIVATVLKSQRHSGPYIHSYFSTFTNNWQALCASLFHLVPSTLPLLRLATCYLSFRSRYRDFFFQEAFLIDLTSGAPVVWATLVARGDFNSYETKHLHKGLLERQH